MFTFIEISNMWSHEHLPLRTLIRLFTQPYKRQGKAGKWLSEVQWVLSADFIVLLLHQVVNSGTQNCVSNKEFAIYELIF